MYSPHEKLFRSKNSKEGIHTDSTVTHTEKKSTKIRLDTSSRSFFITQSQAFCGNGVEQKGTELCWPNATLHRNFATRYQIPFFVNLWVNKWKHPENTRETQQMSRILSVESVAAVVSLHSALLRAIMGGRQNKFR